ncbi:hypothetical protein OF897_18325 [Chryseobacterium formosus]|uniref:Uncharacterized protein n=1 Tax=Chryseobacterium formosus TaxID=1537363 RepID=A0ABT3XW41_9FLAO|nr:hypothetical protein [Chryseobacterium formosus]MCX8525874.1 hypothetical protein [Chryseobacterium formosus]
MKITDRTGDYDFELIKSVSNSNLKGKLVRVSNARYQNIKIVTKEELSEARTNFRQNARRELEGMGTLFLEDQKPKQMVRETEKKGHNPIELED